MDESDVLPESIRRGWHPAVCLATGLGIGHVPLAPGTVGSAVWGLPLAWMVGEFPLWARLLVIVLVCAAGIPLCTRAARMLGDEDDPGSIVLDEVASMPITFLLVPMSSWLVVAIGFALNRLFDITKPPPARQLERLPHGLGVMADDWAAGVYSSLGLYLLIWLGWLPGPGG